MIGSRAKGASRNWVLWKHVARNAVLPTLTIAGVLFGELLAGAVRRVVCAGTRAPEMALRLKYAGWPEDRIAVEPDIAASLDSALAASPGRLFALPTYTALLELHKLLADRGLAKEFWR